MKKLTQLLFAAPLVLGLCAGALAQEGQDPLLDPAVQAQIDVENAAFEARSAQGQAERLGDEQEAAWARVRARQAERLARLAASKAAERGAELRAEELLKEAEGAERISVKKALKASKAQERVDGLRSAGAATRSIAQAETKAYEAEISATLAKVKASNAQTSARLAAERANLKIDEKAAELARTEAAKAAEHAEALSRRAELRIDENAAEVAVRNEAAYRTIARWPIASQALAKVTMSEYDVPDEVTRKALIWNDNAPWKRTVLSREAALVQSVSYDVPEGRLESLKQMDIGVRVNPKRTELIASSGSEATNVLAFNLANEVIREKRTPEGAREFYVKTIALAQAGKSSPYLEGLIYDSPDGR